MIRVLDPAPSEGGYTTEDTNHSPRVKEVCVADVLQEQSMSTEALNQLVFADSVVGSSSATVISTASSVGAIESDSSVCGPPPRSLPQASRQGRLSQRWDRSVRLTTGCVPILRNGQILCISANKKAEWILPKGGWENDESIEASALREAFEEAGVSGVLGPHLEDIHYESRKAKKRRLMEEELSRSLHRSDTASRASSDKDDGSAAPLEEGKHDDMKLGPPQVRVVIPEALAPTVSVRSIETDTLSHTSHSYSHIRMTLFPLYVTHVADSWPEGGRFRKAVDIDTAIAEARPEFRQALEEIKQRKLHLSVQTAQA